jgi:hypothetical protein
VIFDGKRQALIIKIRLERGGGDIGDHRLKRRANTISAAIPRRPGYRLARLDELPPAAPAHSGRLQIWVMERPSPDRQD